MDIVINTDLSVEGTMISVDGEKVGENSKIASITFYADAPNKRYEDSGYVSVSVASFDDEGNIKRVNYSQDKKIADRIKPIGIEDDVKETDMIRFLGDEVDQEKKRIADKIIAKSLEDKLACPEMDTLLNRSVESLTDKAIDLGITLADA